MSRIVAEAEALMFDDLAPARPAYGLQMRPLGPAEGCAGWVQPITESMVEAVRQVSPETEGDAGHRLDELRPDGAWRSRSSATPRRRSPSPPTRPSPARWRFTGA